ncbi:hypothetical protein HN695_04580 [Candidatus Woesearchaeota archaeon]|nr:hypothetical protein [Candidatus Woesearchaeota archaeon]MBT5271852.1 hypothetical protein [Candidatus Woesearchaeota archaeon]MBT6041684.1 hypothetical protein [Candidatus Woesearchaeota archaeon]MBT6337340.1 hypothetical protein [Candidatus Woesearchaeota archaeon]MBT7927588.1 hypothetical protein [Candidatus Woesearchaeota archaeon]
MKLQKISNIFLFLVGIIAILLVFSILGSNPTFVGKATLAMQGYAVAEVSFEQLGSYQDCIDIAEQEYPPPVYERQDKYCQCFIEGNQGCEIYIKDRGFCDDGYLPGTERCGKNKDPHGRIFVEKYYQFSDCSKKAYNLQKCEYGCTEGQCGEDLCRETDNGFNVFETGTTTGQKKEGQQVDENDKCISAKKLTEHYCDKDGFANFKIASCDFGCVEGKCRTVKCTDSDGGEEPTVKGVVKGGMSGSGAQGLVSDSCLNGKTLKEYKCGSNGGVGYTTMECPNSCSEGRCT